MIKYLRLFAIGITWLLAVQGGLFSAQYYISTEGKASGSGTMGDPWDAVPDLRLVLKPGDEVIFRGGTYKKGFKVSAIAGQHGKPVVYRPMRDERVIFDLSEEPGNGITVGGSAFVVIRGFEVIGPENGVGISLGHVRDSVVEGNVVHDSGIDAISLSYSDHNIIRGNICYYNRNSVNLIWESSRNVVELNVAIFGNKSSENADGLKALLSKYNIFRYNIMLENRDDGMDLWNSLNNLVEYNISVRNGDGEEGDGNGYKLGGRRRYGPMMSEWQGGGNTVRFNIAYDNLKTGFTDNNSDNNSYEGNVSYDNVEHVENDGDASVLHTDPANGQWIKDKIRGEFKRVLEEGLIRPDIIPLPEEFDKVRALGVWPEGY